MLRTDDLAQAIGVKPGSIRTRLCRTGSYFGLRPKKLPNGRLLWPGDSVEQLTAQTTTKPRSDTQSAGNARTAVK